jgi:hypothetical protein
MRTIDFKKIRNNWVTVVYFKILVELALLILVFAN